jgi:parallel beta-helix repeat protein
MMFPSAPLCRSFTLCCAAVLALTACGGGGGGADSSQERNGIAGTPAPLAPLPAPAPAPATPDPVDAPYLRRVTVDPNHTNASDTGAGTAAQPYRTISTALARLQPGDDIVIAAGTYREALVVPTLTGASAPTRLRAAAARSVTVKGSIEVGGWALVSPGVYAVPWTREEPQQVYLAGQALQQIGGTVFGGYPTTPPPELASAHANEGGIWPGRTAGGVAQLVPGSFTHDAAASRLLVRTAQPLGAGQVLEVSVHRHVLQAEAAIRLTVEGLDFMHASTSTVYRQGAVKVAGDGNTLRNLAVRDMDAACVQLLGNDNALLDSELMRCGQLGLLGRGLRMTVAGNRISQANTRGFNKWWEAGGMKLIGPGGLHDAVIRQNTVSFSDGDGIWIDWKNSGNLIEANTVAYNTGFGIHYEASRTGTIRGNTVYGNGLRGIYLMESSGSTVQGNAVFGNTMEGIAVVDGTRSATDPELSPLNNRVTGNAVAWNDDQRNWVQLVLPGPRYGSLSDANVFKSEQLGPRMAMGFPSASAPAYESLQAWRNATQQDLGSSAERVALPEVLRSALQARRMLESTELPAFLRNPGQP